MTTQIGEFLYAHIDDFGDVILSEFEDMSAPIIRLSVEDQTPLMEYLDEHHKKAIELCDYNQDDFTDR